jgi:hypothetical protein
MSAFTRQHVWIWTAFLGLWLPLAQAYDNGIYKFSRPLTKASDYLLTAPTTCLEKLKPQLENNAKTDGSAADLLAIQTHQLAALCAARAGLIEQAITQSQTAISLSNTAQLPKQKIISELIQAQIYVHDPQNQKKAEQSLNAAQQLRTQLRNTGNHLITFELSRNFARLEMNRGNMSLAKDQLLNAKDMAYASGESLLMGWAEANLGDYYQRLEQDELALSHYVDAAKFASDETPAALLLKGEIEFHISQIYLVEDEVDKAIRHQNLAVQTAQRQGDTRLMAIRMASLASLYQDAGSHDIALAHYLNAQELANQGVDNYLRAQIELHLGETYLQQDDIDSAQAHLNNARRRFSRYNDPAALISTLLLLGETQIKNNEPGLAILQLKHAQSLAKNTFSSQQGQIYRLLSKAYENNASYQEALDLFKRFHELSDQLQQAKDKQRRKHFTQHYQYIEQAQQLSDLTRDNALLKERLHNRELTAMVLLALLLLTILVWSIYRQRAIRLGFEGDQLRDALHYHRNTGWVRLGFSEAPLSAFRALGKYPFTDPANARHIIVSMQLFGIHLDKTIGFSQRNKLERSFAKHLGHHLDSQTIIGHMGRYNYLLVAPLNDISAPEFCAQLIATCEDFIKEYQLALKVALGCCEAPFIENAKDAIDDSGICEITSLALDGAQQLVVQTGTSQWVELKALSCSPATLLGESLSQDVKKAISKGLIKLSASSDKTLIKW